LLITSWATASRYSRVFQPAFSPLLVLYSYAIEGAYSRALENQYLQAHTEPRQLRG